ncbi:MAG TPA: hypothetical protein VGB55_11030 [Tepidisphaeraceae bacterium]|jgi:hypothetical protein
MMAKMFYTLEEAKVALGKGDDEIKQLTREGRLREFRDGPRLMFKADQVETLKSEFGGSGDIIDLGPSDTGAPIGLVDSRSGSSPVISLADSDMGRGNSGSGAPNLKEDTALAADLGLSGSIGLSGSMGGMPSPSRPGAGSGLSGLSGTSQGSRGGINLLGDDTGDDPSAQTAINPAMNDPMGAEGMGSGSGLLDLTRESDNTSLGAVLDEIPGDAGGTRAGETFGGASFTGGSLAGGSLGGGASGLTSGISPGISAPSASRVITPPNYVEAKDALSPALGGMALLTSLFALLGIIALAGGVSGTRPGLLDSLQNQGFMIVALIGIVLAVLGFVGGLIIGKVRG